ncbi:MAG: LemA family protein [Limisphaerales bacterium]
MTNGPEWLPLVPWIGFVGALACLWAAIRAARCKRLVNDLPTSKTTGVFIGLVEVKGTAESEAPLTSYLAEQPCVCYSWSVEEHWSRTVTESYTDNEGRTQTRTRHESGWTTVANGSDTQAFYLKDDCGVVRVIPDDAKIDPQTVFDETCSPLSGLYYTKGPAGAVGDSDFRRRFSEQAILLHVPLYVMGQARERDDMVAAEIAADKNAPMFLISTRSEEQISSSFGWGEWAWGFFGLVLCLVGAYALSYLQTSQPNPIVLVLAGVVYLGVAAGCWVWMVFNSLIDLRQRVRQGWSQVDVQLKRRHDLIPNLVQTVEGLRDYERNLQTELATLRSQLGATPPGQPGPDYQATSKILIAVAERYPELTAQQSFLNLQQNLSDTEQRIALARGYFNEIATYYNTRLQIIPDKFIAPLGGLREQPLMQANDFERAPVEVSLADGENTKTAAA